MADYRFDGRVVAITGAGQGLGEAYARECAALGAIVIVNDLGDVARTVARAIVADGGRAVAVLGDIADPDTSAAIVSAAIDGQGRIDAIVNNAGIGLNRPFVETSIDDFRRVIEINFFGTVHLIRAAWPYMAAAGYGRIVNIVSTSLYGFEGWSGYAASKGAVLGMTRTMALEARALGIGVNMLAPAAATPMMLDNDIDAVTQRFMRETMPPEKVAPTAAFLAHETCTSSGLTYCASGGRIAPIVLAEAPGVTMDAPDLAQIAAAVGDPGFAHDLIAIPSVMEGMNRAR